MAKYPVTAITNFIPESTYQQAVSRLIYKLDLDNPAEIGDDSNVAVIISLAQDNDQDALIYLYRNSLKAIGSVFWKNFIGNTKFMKRRLDAGDDSLFAAEAYEALVRALKSFDLSAYVRDPVNLINKFQWWYQKYLKYAAIRLNTEAKKAGIANAPEEVKSTSFPTSDAGVEVSSTDYSTPDTTGATDLAVSIDQYLSALKRSGNKNDKLMYDVLSLRMQGYAPVDMEDILNKDAHTIRKVLRNIKVDMKEKGLFENKKKLQESEKDDEEDKTAGDPVSIEDAEPIDNDSTVSSEEKEDEEKASDPIDSEDEFAEWEWDAEKVEKKKAELAAEQKELIPLAKKISEMQLDSPVAVAKDEWADLIKKQRSSKLRVEPNLGSFPRPVVWSAEKEAFHKLKRYDADKDRMGWKTHEAAWVASYLAVEEDKDKAYADSGENPYRYHEQKAFVAQFTQLQASGISFNAIKKDQYFRNLMGVKETGEKQLIADRFGRQLQEYWSEAQVAKKKVELASETVETWATFLYGLNPALGIVGALVSSAMEIAETPMFQSLKKLATEPVSKEIERAYAAERARTLVDVTPEENKLTYEEKVASGYFMDAEEEGDSDVDTKDTENIENVDDSEQDQSVDETEEETRERLKKEEEIKKTNFKMEPAYESKSILNELFPGIPKRENLRDVPIGKALAFKIKKLSDSVKHHVSCCYIIAETKPEGSSKTFFIIYYRLPVPAGIREDMEYMSYADLVSTYRRTPGITSLSHAKSLCRDHYMGQGTKTVSIVDPGTPAVRR